MKPELILGTAQFGFNYGITNKKGKINAKDVFSILKKASEYQIKKLDTAQNYGDSELVIGAAKSKKISFKISSKLFPIEENINSYELKNIWLESLKKSLFNLKVEKLDSLFVHRSKDLLGYRKKELLKWLLEVKKDGLISKIGVSIYHDANVKDLPLDFIDLIQLPLSIYDQRSIRSGLISFLKSKNIKIQARSIFLQGLTLCKPSLLPSWVSLKDKKSHKIFWDFCASEDISALELSLNFLKSQDNIDSIVFGIEDLNQLNQINSLWIKKDTKKIDIDFLNFSDQFLDPRKWPRELD
tara:strand:+ start:78826 stop:79719 length:894 start_codon:yes stop_codon:yes gene_type:complete